MHANTETTNHASAIEMATTAAMGRRKSALILLQRYLKDLGDTVVVPFDDANDWCQVNGEDVFRITLDHFSTKEGRAPRRGLRFRLANIGYEDTERGGQWAEPPRGFSDGWLRQMAQTVHDVALSMKRTKKHEEERKRQDREMAAEAGKINVELGIKVGEPGFVTMINRQLRIQMLGWLSPAEARKIATCIREVHRARLEIPAS